MKKIFARTIGIGTSLTLALQFAKNAFAQLSTTPATSGSTGSAVTKGGLGGVETTGSSLPNAGTAEVTYLIFGIGIVLFVLGMMKLAQSFRD